MYSILMNRICRPAPKEVERRKQQIGKNLCCPYCQEGLTKWEVSQSPFIQWDNDYVYVCFNDRCPYMLEGWEVMRQQGNKGFSYRLVYDPDRNRFFPSPLPSPMAMRNTVIHERG